ncbi:hypothetical protein B5X24_HaOG207827 [Helicoverpa armigera]|uniref:Homologous recombination OB-fold protein OB-fold domain-containing protein n=1 Tax=Helicoverpa armigera TaxID=29058 RepID=A0A2W1BP19_HELAM|nr:hypothetical protein B5X24_HaOG207827 [Helicoverpa armigera]
MFESDDFDQVLSQFEFPEDPLLEKKRTDDKNELNKPNLVENITSEIISTNAAQNTKLDENVPTKIHNSKRNNENINIDVDFTQNSLRGDLFESPLWARLLDDLKIWNLNDIDSIKTVKQQAISGNLKRRKAHTITAFVETVDRSAADPLIVMRDRTGNIKGTLHRDAWSTFSKYIASEYCAFILWKPTILTTGSAFKKHYLNITLSNILAIYSSTVLTDDADAKPLPDGYAIVYEEDYTVIKTQKNLNTIGTNETLCNGVDSNPGDFLDELDTIFSEDIF